MQIRNKILVIYTGGTIGMVHNLETNTLVPFNFDQIKAEMPELAKIKHEIISLAFNEPIDSSNSNPAHWINLVEIIESNYDAYDGFVILHGSDTMAFTASALSFMLENLAKPVIITGSQLPIGEIRTDARENLVTSIEIAAAKENGLPLVPEVAIYFDYKLLRGNRSKKTHSQKFEAFQSPNYPKLATAGTEIVYHKTFILSPTNKPLIAHKNLDFSANIAVLKLFPGISKKYVENLVADLSLDALIIEAYGIGNAPSADWFLNAIRSLADRGIPIIDISQCLGGSVELGKYETSNGLLKAGVISGKDLTFEACVTKLMFLFAKKLPPNEVSKWMKSALAGELSM